MALIQCPNCGKKISGLANACPFCDYALKEFSLKETADSYYSEEQEGYLSRKASSRVKTNPYPYQPSDFSDQNNAQADHSQYRTVPDENQNRKTASPDTRNAFHNVNAGSMINEKKTSAYEKTGNSIPKNVSSDVKNNSSKAEHIPAASFKSRPGSAGHRLLGYREGNFVHMFLMLFYDLAAAVLILYGFKSVPQYAERGLMVWQVARTITGALLLYMPTLLLSLTGFRKKFPLLKKRNARTAIFSLILAYIPVLILFIFICLKFK